MVVVSASCFLSDMHSHVLVIEFGHGKKGDNQLIKAVLIILGTLFLIIGTVGIFLPILPTTPFLILAAACYLRSSNRMYNWLLSNRLFGNYLRNYLEKKGIPMRVKIATILILWSTILLSAFVFIDIIYIRILLILIAIGVTIHMLWIKTY